jgi:hypothetical protein
VIKLIKAREWWQSGRVDGFARPEFAFGFLLLAFGFRLYLLAACSVKLAAVFHVTSGTSL